MSDQILPERIDYGDRELNAEHLASLPMTTFRQWMQEAVEHGIVEANAVCLCTVDKEGHPDGRIVLLKGIEDDGLLFYTNYTSRKGSQLEHRSHASIVSWWEPLKRQIRVAGSVEKLTPEESDRYFLSRPRESRLGAWASDQSKPIASREALMERLEGTGRRFAEKDVPRPEHWGGYRLVPSRFEFWQGRNSRIHDRFEYLRTDVGWRIRRLMP